MAEKEGKFGKGHLLATFAIAAVTAVVTGYIFDPSILAFSHYTDAGLAQTQVTTSLIGSFNEALSDFMMYWVWDPLRDSLGITTEFVGVTANGANQIAPNVTANGVTGGSGLKLSNPSL